MKEKFKELADILYSSIIKGIRFKEHTDLIIAGYNTSGKTTILYLVLQRALKEYPDAFYYIDPKNRTIVDQLINTQQYNDYEVKEILEERLKKGNYTNKDVFVPAFSGGTVTYSELCKNFEEYQKLFEKILNLNFEYITTQKETNPLQVIGQSVFKINGEYDIFSLANSEAAKARIIMEVNFACKKGCKVVIIDEFDDHLDNDNMIKFFELLRENFSEIRFVIAIHNYEPLVNMNNADALVFDGQGDPRFVNCDDITQLGEVDRLRSKFMGKERKEEKKLADCLSFLIKNSVLSREQEDYINSLDRNKLLNRERIIYDYIIEKREKNED